MRTHEKTPSYFTSFSLFVSLLSFLSFDLLPLSSLFVDSLLVFYSPFYLHSFHHLVFFTPFPPFIEPYISLRHETVG